MEQSESTTKLRYPRLRFSRRLMRGAIRLILGTLGEVELVGMENLPERGPLLIVANHFSFLDPAAMIYATPYPLEFLAGAVTPNAPRAVSWLRKVWGVFPVHRGAVSRSALRSAETILDQEGVVGVFPEAGNWAQVLRPARPGSAYLAARSGAQLLPMGFSGLVNFFDQVRNGSRPQVKLNIGRPFGPFRVSGRGPERRVQLDLISRTIMERIAELLPDHLRGHFADDPATRAAAVGTEIYPWDESPEI